MAITINTRIAGQEATSTLTYCYLYEPLKIVVSENDASVEKVFVDIDLIDAETGVVNDSLLKYVDFDITSLGSIEIDLMKVATQLMNFDILKIQSVDDIVSNWESVVSKNIYNFKIYTDVVSTPLSVLKLPIMGSRFFEDFVATVSNSNSLNEFSSASSFDFNLGGYSYAQYALKDISSVSDSNYSPTRSKVNVTSTSANQPCEGVIHYKSKLGGWCSFGMDLSTEDRKGKYLGKIARKGFSSTENINGNPFIQVNYTSVDFSYTIKLKKLSLDSSVLEELSGIQGSLAVYYQRTPTSRLELMKLTTASTPINSLTGGGDFSISLKSVLTQSQRAI